MSSQKITKIMLLLSTSVMLTILLYNLNKNSESLRFSYDSISKRFSSQRRGLSTIEGDEGRLIDLCKKKESVYNKYYSTSDKSEEIEPIKVNRNAMVDSLIELIDEGKTEGLTSGGMISKIAIYIIFLAVSIISLIGWVFCCFCSCCDCCKCCCCKPAETEEKEGMCRLISLFGAIILFGVICILSITGLSLVNKLLDGINGFGCSLLQFLRQLIDGEISQNTPRWAGTKEIGNKFHELSGVINEIDGGIEEQNKLKDDFNDSVDQDEINGDKITAEGKVDTRQKDEYKEIVINNFDREMDIFRITGNNFIDTVSDSISNIVDDIDNVRDSIGEVSDTLNDINEQFGDLWDDFSSKIFDLSDYVSVKGKKVFKSFYSVLTVISIGIIAVLILYKFLGWCIFRFLLFPFWNILALLMVVLFLLGGLLGVIGTIGIEGVEFIKYVLSEDNLNGDKPVLINQEDLTSKLNVCINGNGDLSSAITVGGGKTARSKFEDINKMFEQFEAGSEDKDKINDIATDSSVVCNYEDGKLRNLEEINRNLEESDSEFKNYEIILRDLNEEVGKCDPHDSNKSYLKDDKFVYRRSECLSIYEMEYKGASDSKNEGKSVCVFPFKEENFYERYSTCGNHDVIRIRLNDAINYREKYNTYIIGKDDPSIEELYKIYDADTALSKRYTGARKALKEYFDYLFELVEDIHIKLGGDEIFDLINCNFIRKNADILVDETRTDLGKNLKSYGDISISISACICLGIIFLIIVLNRYKSGVHKQQG